MKMSRTRMYALSLCSAGFALGAALGFRSYGVHPAIFIPICVVLAWFQMGFFMKMWDQNSQKIAKKKVI